MRVRHLTQRGRSIGKSKLSVVDEVTRLALIGREPNTLGHRQLPKKTTVITEPKPSGVFRLSETGHNREGTLSSKSGTVFLIRRGWQEDAAQARIGVPEGRRRFDLPRADVFSVTCP
jgi:hypothetical protein